MSLHQVSEGEEQGDPDLKVTFAHIPLARTWSHDPSNPKGGWEKE